MPAPSPEKNSGDKNVWVQIAKYSQMALALPAAVVVGLFLGMGLDRWLRTSYWTLIGLVLGCVAGFTELMRVIAKVSKEK
jgi:F0F1-type ATP synthase assembly protein I